MTWDAEKHVGAVSLVMNVSGREWRARQSHCVWLCACKCRVYLSLMDFFCVGPMCGSNIVTESEHFNLKLCKVIFT